MALVMLDLIGGNEKDEALAERFGEHEAVAAGAAYLAGFAVEALALQRREPVPATWSSYASPSVRVTTVTMDSAGCGSLDAHVPHRAERRHRSPASRCRSQPAAGATLGL